MPRKLNQKAPPDPHFVERAIKALGDSDVQIRRQGARDLIEFPTVSAARFLEKALSDADSIVRRDAGSALLAIINGLVSEFEWFTKFLERQCYLRTMQLSKAQNRIVDLEGKLGLSRQKEILIRRKRRLNRWVSREK